MTLDVTKSGIQLLLKCIANECSIDFNKIVLGNGNRISEDDNQLSNPQAEMEMKGCSRKENYISIEASLNNNNITSSFIANEMGVFAQEKYPDGQVNPELILFAYGYAEDSKAIYIPKYTEYLFETVENISVWVGEAENISATISSSLSTVSRNEFEEHTNDKANPHKVTAEQVGLGNVENVKFAEQRPYYTESVLLENLAVGEKMSIILGKIAKAISSLLGHLRDYENPHQVTPEKIKAAKSTHTHGASDITSGTLSVSRGGTGVTSYSALRKKLGLGSESGVLTTENGGTGVTNYHELSSKLIETGTYVGDGEATRTFNLGYTPRILIIHCPTEKEPEYNCIATRECNGIAADRGDSENNYFTTYSKDYVTGQIIDNGFRVSYCSNNNCAKTNVKEKMYIYIIVK